MPRARLIALFVGGTIFVAWPVWAQSPSELLEKGIHAEDTAGRLDDAIAAYGQVVVDLEADVQLRAQAQYGLGRCQFKKRNRVAAAEAFRRAAALAAAAGEKSVRDSAIKHVHKLGTSAAGSPVVILTTPPALANDVSPSLDRITVTFDKPMMDRSWSWTGGGDTYPEIKGKPRYDKQKTTCTIPVKLEPGKVYWVGVNSKSHKNFKTPDRQPARWHVILFATKDAEGNPTPLPEKMKMSAIGINWSEPIVVHTQPAPFARDVSPSLDKITVTFDRPMMDRSWSWTGGGETYPELTDKPRYDDRKVTCTLAVKLEPGKVYWVGINSPSHRNFRSSAGVPVPWYSLLFATADDRGKPTKIPGEMLERAKTINGGMPVIAIPAAVLDEGGREE